MTSEEYKTCVRCRLIFPKTTEFFNRAGPYLQSYCKPCEKEKFHEIYVTRRDAAYAAGTRKKKIPLTLERKRAQALAYYYRHKDQINARMRDRYVDPEKRLKTLAAQAEYRRLHPDKRALFNKRWAAAHPESRAESSRRRRANELSTRVVARLSYKAILLAHGRICHICSEPILLTDKIHFDHIIPLAKGGTHTQDNVAPSHSRCNLRKGVRLIG